MFKTRQSRLIIVQSGSKTNIYVRDHENPPFDVLTYNFARGLQNNNVTDVLKKCFAMSTNTHT